ncbi:sporulation related protein [Aliiruegeria haliotis]|uniref:Sporulation related protein n=1 Tax=Aliiruegeria haliotis TaxID=1280846 RepID=A0A2T0RZL0_9RHOB|nr:SPOR domain-containing protein [Aliiruegeria haliotis]PRY26614.1 sporulation related protein [Aliiruegeria haliotis]
MLDPAYGQGRDVVQASYGSEHRAFELGAVPEGAEAYQVAGPGKARLFIHVMGAVVSLGLIGGCAYWGYSQVMRDLNGVPVVRALEGPMRVAPETPGGAISDHAGLAVNDVQALGVASVPESQLVLAPEPVALTEADTSKAEAKAAKEAESATEALAQVTVDDAPVTPASLTEDIPADDPIAKALALATAATAGSEPLSTKTDEDISGTARSIVTQEGVIRSIRPVVRPVRAVSPSSNGVTGEGAIVTRSTSTKSPQQVAAADVPAGTRLVQLGAFDTQDEAEAAWGRISGRFGALMEDKAQVILEASAGGRDFWRLRAMGFSDLSEARRFCAALVAESADCIPVVAR